MAIRYLVGSGTWNSTNTAIWSTTLGGTSGASVPTSGDTVYAYGSPYITGVITTSSPPPIRNLYFGGTYNPTYNVSGIIYIESGGYVGNSGGFDVNARPYFLGSGTLEGTIKIAASEGGLVTWNSPGSVNELRCNPPSSGISGWIITGASTVNSLQFNGSSTGTAQIYSNSLGTQRKLSVGSLFNGNLSTKIFWRDIDIDGSAAPISGNNFVDGGNNTDIIFPATGSGFFFGSNF